MRPIVDSATMRLIEDRSIAAGQTIEGLMDMVGLQLAHHVQTILRKSQAPLLVVLLAGKGNNGADGYSALSLLLQQKIACCAWQVASPSPNSLLDRRKKAFVKKGGTVVEFPDVPRVNGPIVIIDGIYGAGFKGKPDPASSKAILWANAQRGLVVSIDVPSGIDPSTGEALGDAIYADYTVACQFPKRGCFLHKGWEHTGSIIFADLPLPLIGADMCLLELSDVFHMLPRKARMQNKFQAGSVVAIAGSTGMMGAASLACEAAYTVGAGYVRLLLSEKLVQEGCQVPREVVRNFLSGDVTEYVPWIERADSLFIGPGLGRTRETMDRIGALWPHLRPTTVVDADALFWLSTIPEQQWDIQNKVLTPHLGEASRLFHRNSTTIDEPLLQYVRTMASTNQATFVLKGAPTFLFSPSQPILVMPRGDPGMATAGTGDVLTGIIAGLLAQKITPHSAAVLGTYLHGLAGERASRMKTSYGMTASSLLQALPSAFFQLLDQGTGGLHRRYAPFGRSEYLNFRSPEDADKLGNS